MPIITSIKPQKNQKRVNIYLDNKFGFGLDLENFLKLHLKIEQELNPKEIEEIVRKGEFQKTLERLLVFATLRPRSEKEVKDYFRRKKVPEILHEELVNKLIHFELLNDLKFAKWWVEGRLQFKLKSKKDISFELRQKGISDKFIKEVLEENEIDESKIAKELLEKRYYKWEKFDEKIKKQKIMQYLAGKGFNWDIINKVIDNMGK